MALKKAEWKVAGLAASFVCVAVALLVVPSSIFIAFDLHWECGAGERIKAVAPSLLSPEELRTLEPTSSVCPTTFTFLQGGRRNCLVALDDQVVVGCG